MQNESIMLMKNIVSHIVLLKTIKIQLKILSNEIIVRTLKFEIFWLHNVSIKFIQKVLQIYVFV